MRVFMPIIIATLSLIWIKNTEGVDTYLNDSTLLEGVIAIKLKSKYSYELTNISKYVLQNIGRATVTVKKNMLSLGTSIMPCEKKKLDFTSNFCIQKSIKFVITNNDSIKRAIVYISDFNKKYIQKPEEDYDKIMVVEKVFNLGVKNITTCGTLDELISYFWTSNGDNVWNQTFHVIKVLLEPKEEKKISQWIENDIIYLKRNLDEIINLTNGYRDDWENMNYLIQKVVTSNMLVDHRTLKYNFKLHFNFLPLYSNLITLKTYFIRLVTGNPEMFYLDEDISTEINEHFKEMHNNKQYGTKAYITKLKPLVMTYLYDTVYAPGLYNLIMTARSHFAVHGMDLIPIWMQVHSKIANFEWSYTKNTQRLEAISYSKYYGKATPNLLQQAIHFRKSSLSVEAELTSISFNITEGIVCGLKLKFLSNSTFTMGTFETENHKNVLTLTLSNRKIFQLKVYKYIFIRCLEFTLSDSNNSTYGDCQDKYEEYEEFELKDHYIHSLYLANDNTETDTYFDNVAVSYLLIPGEVF